MSTHVQPVPPIGSRSDLVWVDSHCHLDMLKASGPEKEDAAQTDQCALVSKALERAFDAGVGHFLCVSVDLADYPGLRACAALNARISRSAGIHPSTEEARPQAQWTQELSSLLAEPGVVAVGETGLDYHYDTIDPQTQRDRYAVHIALARETGLPLIIHTRQARSDTMALLRSEGAGAVSGVMHCFTEDWTMAKAALDLGFYISFSGIITFKNAQELRDVAKKVPLDRMLVETDSPYLAPVPFRGRSNVPSLVPWVGQVLAELQGVDSRALARCTTENYFSLFGKAVQISDPVCSA